MRGLITSVGECVGLGLVAFGLGLLAPALGVIAAGVGVFAVSFKLGGKR
jgi:hypothetical protein